MLEPSSSEDENETTNPEVDDTSSAVSSLPASGRQSQNTNANHLQANFPIQRSVSPSIEPTQNNVPLPNYSNDKFLQTRSSLNNLRATSPNPPELTQETTPEEEEQIDDAEKAEREEAERKSKLQLYVFVLRCVAYPFNAKQPTDLTTRLIKITLSQLEQIVNRFQAFLNGELQIPADEPFISAIHNYFEAFLRSNRLHMIVASGACSAHDFREVFRLNIEKRVRSLPEMEGMTKESLISQWLTKFDTIFRGFDEIETKKLTGTKMQQYQQQQQQNLASEIILSKEQLYDMFQNILKIKKFEHQLLYNALQLDSADEQTAAIRRELDGRIQRCSEMEKNRKLMPKFVLKEMECLYLDEVRSSINQLMVNLESLPVSKGSADSRYGLQKLKRYNHSRRRSSVLRHVSTAYTIGHLAQ